MGIHAILRKTSKRGDALWKADEQLSPRGRTRNRNAARDWKSRKPAPRLWGGRRNTDSNREDQSSARLDWRNPLTRSGRRPNMPRCATVLHSTGASANLCERSELLAAAAGAVAAWYPITGRSLRGGSCYSHVAAQFRDRTHRLGKGSQ